MGSISSQELRIRRLEEAANKLAAKLANFRDKLGPIAEDSSRQVQSSRQGGGIRHYFAQANGEISASAGHLFGTGQARIMKEVDGALFPVEASGGPGGGGPAGVAVAATTDQGFALQSGSSMLLESGDGLLLEAPPTEPPPTVPVLNSIPVKIADQTDLQLILSRGLYSVVVASCTAEPPPVTFLCGACNITHGSKTLTWTWLKWNPATAANDLIVTETATMVESSGGGVWDSPIFGPAPSDSAQFHGLGGMPYFFVRYRCTTGWYGEKADDPTMEFAEILTVGSSSTTCTPWHGDGTFTGNGGYPLTAVISPL